MSLDTSVSKQITDFMKSDLAPLQKWKSIKALLLEKQIAFYSTLRADSFVVHRCNRSGTLVNPHNMHNKGMQILQAGADKSMLHSVCTELHPDNDKKQAAIADFKALCESPYMAPVTGAERYASLSSGHTSQFVKAVLAGVDTPEAELADANGKLGPHLYRCDSGEDWHQMCTSGWSWLVLPFYVEERHPDLIDLIQNALNMSNSIFGIQSEIELASSIAAAVKAKGGHVEDWNQLALDCCQGPSLKKGDQYKAIAKFVRLCSGALAVTSYSFCLYWPYLTMFFFMKKITLHFFQSMHVTYVHVSMYVCFHNI